MKIAFLCKRRYMSKDVVMDRYARLYEIPRQLALKGHDVQAFCLDYRDADEGVWVHPIESGRLVWHSQSLNRLKGPSALWYPGRVLSQLKALGPDVVIAASDIPHIALGAWLARKLECVYVADLYDNFEGFGQAKIPGFVRALRWGTRQASLVTTTSEALRSYVEAVYQPQGEVVAIPSSVDLTVFKARDKQQARASLGLPADAKLIGTAGGLYRDKGIEPLYQAWPQIRAARPDVHLVLAGPTEAHCPPPSGERVHCLGLLPHDQVAQLFSALDVGVISVLDTPFGRYCFPQKAYEMLATSLPVVAAAIGATGELFRAHPGSLFQPGDADSLTHAVLQQLENGVRLELPIPDWSELVSRIDLRLSSLPR